MIGERAAELIRAAAHAGERGSARPAQTPGERARAVPQETPAERAAAPLDDLQPVTPPAGIPAAANAAAPIVPRSAL